MVKRDKEKFNLYMREYRQKHLEEIRKQDRVRCAKRRETEEYKDYHIDYYIQKTGNVPEVGYFIICPECGEVKRHSISRLLTHITNGICKKCYYKSLKGGEPWNKGVRTATPETEKDYKEPRWSSEYRDWHNECLRRDWYHCQLCESKERLEVHHIKSYKDYPQERLNLDNGITLCKKCHLEVHNFNVLAQQ